MGGWIRKAVIAGIVLVVLGLQFVVGPFLLFFLPVAGLLVSVNKLYYAYLIGEPRSKKLLWAGILVLSLLGLAEVVRVMFFPHFPYRHGRE